MLTSGQRNKATDGADLIRNLIVKASGRIIIMPGGGISDNNIVSLAKVTGASEYHLTARKSVKSGMEFRKDEITMSGIAGYDEYSKKVADIDMIRRIVDLLKAI